MNDKQKQALRTKIGKTIRTLSVELYGERQLCKLSDAIGMTQPALSEIANGKSFPSLLTARALVRLIDNNAYLTNITINDILGL